MPTRKLLFSLTKRDFVLQTFCSGGKGGQNQNKVATGVRIIHPASGARGESREQRSQLQNRKAAFIRLTETPRFKVWHRVEVARRLGRVAPVDVDAMVRPENLRIEIRRDDKWAEADQETLEPLATKEVG